MFGLDITVAEQCSIKFFIHEWGQTQNDRGSEQPRKEINNVKFAADREKNE